MIQTIAIVGGILAAILSNYLLSAICADIAKEKGYDWDKAFWLCFFLTVVGYLQIAARPDLKARADMEALEEQLNTL